jgi:hypothetical protein
MTSLLYHDLIANIIRKLKKSKEKKVLITPTVFNKEAFLHLLPSFLPPQAGFLSYAETAIVSCRSATAE